MDGPLVSVIIPVYNVSAYLTQCLDSVRGQTYQNIEVLMVNDGSTDGSYDICRRFEQEDSRFLLIDKTNSGVSDSRNVAINLARGKYLQFVDSDDWLTPDAVASFCHTAESTGADLVISHFFRVEGGRVAPRGHIKGDAILTRTEYAEEMMKAPANYYYGVLWNKFYRRSIVEAHRLRFDREVSWCEDFLFNLEYIEHTRITAPPPPPPRLAPPPGRPPALRHAPPPRPLYFYRKRMDSLVNTQSSLRKTIRMKKETFAYYKDLYQKLDLYEEQKSGVYRYLISAANDGTVGPLAPRLPDAERSDPDDTDLPPRSARRRRRDLSSLQRDHREV